MDDRAATGEIAARNKTFVQSAKEKLQKTLSILEIVKKYVGQALLILASRRNLLKVASFTLEFDQVEKQDGEGEAGARVAEHEVYRAFFCDPRRRVWIKFVYRNSLGYFLHTPSEKIRFLATCESCDLFLCLAGTDKLIGKGAGWEFKYSYPLSLNATNSYIKSTVVFKIHTSELFLKDDDFEEFFGFLFNIRLVNNIRTFIKKYAYGQGKPRPEPGVSPAEELRRFVEGEQVEANLVPNVPSKIKFSLKNTVWNVQLNNLDTSPADYFTRIKDKPMVAGDDLATRDGPAQRDHPKRPQGQPHHALRLRDEPHRHHRQLQGALQALAPAPAARQHLRPRQDPVVGLHQGQQAQGQAGPRPALPHLLRGQRPAGLAQLLLAHDLQVLHQHLHPLLQQQPRQLQGLPHPLPRRAPRRRLAALRRHAARTAEHSRQTE
jgi:hypothetical protein